MARSAAGGEDVGLEDLVEWLDVQAVRRLLAAAAECHEGVARAVRLAAADEGQRLAVLRSAVDQGLGPRAFVVTNARYRRRLPGSARAGR